MNLNNVDLNKIRVFHSVVNKGSYHLAGEELGLTRSAISQAMTTLESQLGVKLFQRKGRRLFPTDKAIDLSQEFANYQKSLNLALQKVRGKDQEIEGLIRIGSYYEFAKVHLAANVSQFCQLYPKAKFKFSFDSPSRLQKHLESGLIDLSFSIFPHKGTKEIQSKRILKQELVLISPGQYFKQASNFESLLDLPLIEYYSSHLLIHRWIQTHFNKRRVKLEPVIFAASADMLLKFVEQGLGVGVIPQYLIKDSHVKVVRPTNKKLIDYIWLNQFAGQFSSSAHKEFVKLFSE